MRRALVCSAGSSWAAFQAGALEHLVAGERWDFDVAVGTGIGAMHAALVACGEAAAVQRFWDHADLAALVRPRLRGSWRGGPFRNSPQRRFVEAHVSEARLAARGTQLLVHVMDLVTGQDLVLCYPGADVPLVDAVMAAVATPGMLPPIRHGSMQLAEATSIDSVPLRFAEQLDVDELVALLPGLPTPDRTGPRRYETWRAVLERALAMNLARDVRAGLLDTAQRIAAVRALRTVAEEVPQRAAGVVDDGDVAARLQATLRDAYATECGPYLSAPEPRLVAVTPPQPPGYPLWRFPSGDLAAARALGRVAARRAVSEGAIVADSQPQGEPPERGGVGVFCTPGAARTAFQVGALAALAEVEQPRVVAASSVGALNGAFLATGQIDELVELWSGWVDRDIMGVDWRALASGGMWWSSNLMHNRPQRRGVIDRYLTNADALPGVALRVNLANLTTGDDEAFEWPGGRLALPELVDASVAVPGAIRPAEMLGCQWADGLTVDGCPLERLLLSTGVERAYVAGVAPRHPTRRYVASAWQALLRAVEWNQYSETTLAIDRAQAVNRRIASWQASHARANETIASTVTDPDIRRRAQKEIEHSHAAAGFPYRRGMVEIVALLPRDEIEMFFVDYDPERSRRLLAMGRDQAQERIGTPG